MTRTLLTVAVASALALTLSSRSNDLQAQAGPAATDASLPQVIGARSYSPMVENLDKTMAFYAQLGLKVPPPEKGDSYPWDEEAWHYDLHGGQAPRSQMRFAYANVPGAVPPATALLVEPVEHRDIERLSRPQRVQDPGVSTLVLLVRDLEAAAGRLPASARQRVRRVTAYGGSAQAMTVAVPGAHLVELLQLDPLPQTTAPADVSVIGSWLRVTVDDLDRSLKLYRDQFGIPFKPVMVTDEAFGGLVGEKGARLRMATATLPGTRMTLEFLEVTGVDRQQASLRIQDPGPARLQLTVRNLETALGMLRQAGPSTVASTGGQIITQPQYRVVVVSDLNGLFLVLTDRPSAPPRAPR